MSADEIELPGEDEEIPEDHEIWHLPAGHLWDVKVAHDFDLPEPPATEQFVLRPLAEEYADAYFTAWSSSIAHIRATPGFANGDWPRPMTREENRVDVQRCVREFAARDAFTYVVLDPADQQVLGQVSIHPHRPWKFGPHVRSWVRADHADLDAPLVDAVRAWFDAQWPFVTMDYDGRPV